MYDRFRWYAVATRPFFFVVGLRKPHMDWALPPSFFDRQVPQQGALYLNPCVGAYHLVHGSALPQRRTPHTEECTVELGRSCIASLCVLLLGSACEDIELPPASRRVTPEGMPPIAWWNCSVEGPWKKSMAEVRRGG